MNAQVTKAEALASASELIACLSDSPDGELTETTRVRALQLTSSLTQSLEKPADGLLKFAYSPAIWMSIRSCVHLDIFTMISDKGVVSANDISKATGADEDLIRRLLRVLTASGYVAEEGDGLYGSTRWVSHLRTRTTEGMAKFIYDQSMPIITECPAYFRETGYKNPTDPMNGPFHKAFNASIPIFPWLMKPENKDRWDAANAFFEGDRGSRPSWVTWFPVQDKLLERDRDHEGPLLVDVAGGHGHDLIEFIAQFPSEDGPFILQDQQPVLDSAPETPANIEKHAMDFFKDAPVPGARVYFLKFVMHDYRDEDCLQILRNVMSSMKEGYSHLVINDFILPDTGCPLLAAEWDLMMLALMSSMERTEAQWRSLLAKAGLYIEGIYQPPGDGQGIIVCTL
ncbi:S-adenosyl-L-methionine-dependent methyltransferase [Xylariomycetidae sp. FL2044]|nr:S-adenosyl-L-methionine-dependent methyltransferase [Xylariomycetidae sp. FL2044]